MSTTMYVSEDGLKFEKFADLFKYEMNKSDVMGRIKRVQRAAEALQLGLSDHGVSAKDFEVTAKWAAAAAYVSCFEEKDIPYGSIPFEYHAVFEE